MGVSNSLITHLLERGGESKENSMGLFSYYLGYKRATKKDRVARDSYEDDAEKICDNCGYAARQHSDEGDCPTY
jgi:hypothetical protein